MKKLVSDINIRTSAYFYVFKAETAIDHYITGNWKKFYKVDNCNYKQNLRQK